MYYFIFGKKDKDATGGFPVVSILKNYVENFWDDDICISLPGFMSNTIQRVDDYYKNLKK